MQVEAVTRLGIEVMVDVPEIFPAPAGEVPAVIWSSLRSLAETDLDSAFPRRGNITRIPSPVPTWATPVERARSFEQSLRIRHSISFGRFDVTHAHLAIPTALAIIDWVPTPIVVTEHQSSLPRLLESADHRALYREIIERSAAFIVVATPLKDLLASRIGGDVAERVHVIPNVIDVESLAFRQRRPRSREWIYVGSLLPHKGIDKLLESFAFYQSNYDSRATLTFVGEGPLRRHVEAFADRNHLVDRIDVTGALPHAAVGNRLAHSDVMVHMSPSETFGIAPLEAIASGVPVITLRNGGAEATWGDIADICGEILDLTSTPEDVAKAVSRLEDRQLDLREARAIVRSRYSPDTVGSQIVAVYGKALQ
jgi:glycogen(starch) synthase